MDARTFTAFCLLLMGGVGLWWAMIYLPEQRADSLYMETNHVLLIGDK